MPVHNGAAHLTGAPSASCLSESAHPDYNPDLKRLESRETALDSARKLASKLPPDHPWIKLLRARNLHDLASRSERVTVRASGRDRAGPRPSDFR